MTTANEPSVAELVDDLKRELCDHKNCTYSACVNIRGAIVALTRLERRCAEMEKAQSTLFDAIAHGDDGHRAWLRDAIERHFALPPERANEGKVGG